jgi:regulator of cell morphogenesis and NO signaling
LQRIPFYLNQGYDMTAYNITQTVGSMVAEQIGRSRVFGAFGIDYCCQGGSSLVDACDKAGQNLMQVLDALRRSDEALGDENQTNWAQAGRRELISNIEKTHHRYLRMELPRLTQLLAKIADVHGSRHPNMVEVKRTFERLRSNLETHMSAEEDRLFPMLVAEDTDNSRTPQNEEIGMVVAEMEQDHLAEGSMLAQIKRLTGGYSLPSDGCETFRVALHGLMTLEQDIHIHVHKENNILFSQYLTRNQHNG